MKDIHTIVCPVDFSPGSATATDYAMSLAEKLGASVHLLHVYPLGTFVGPDGGLVITPQMITQLSEQSMTALRKLAEPYTAAGRKVEVHVRDGAPAEERFAEHAEPVPTALVAHIARELLVILEEHAARRTAQELPHGENGHGSVSLSSIRFDERGHPLLTEPGMWSVFGEDAGAWRARVSRLRYRSEHPARAGTADVRDDVFALGACLEALLTRSDGSPKAALLADFASRCASPSGYATVADVRAALDASFPASDHREAIVTWLASQASDVPKTASASGPKPRSPTSQPPSPASQPSAAPGVSQAPAASSVPLHRPRSVESDKSRVVIEQSGTTWPFFVFGIVVGFIATFGYALFRAAS